MPARAGLPRDVDSSPKSRFGRNVNGRWRPFFETGERRAHCIVEVCRTAGRRRAWRCGLCIQRRGRANERRQSAGQARPASTRGSTFVCHSETAAAATTCRTSPGAGKFSAARQRGGLWAASVRSGITWPVSFYAARAEQKYIRPRNIQPVSFCSERFEQKPIRPRNSHAAGGCFAGAECGRARSWNASIDGGARVAG